jgi:hypothetical protein
MTNKIKFHLVCLVMGFFTFNVAKAQDDAPTKGRYYNKNKINFLSGGNNYKDYKGISLSTVHGIHLSERFASGIGIGLSGGQKYDSTIIPVFLNGTLSLTETRKLYLTGDLGYSFATEKVVKGGLIGDISLGWKFMVGKLAIAPEVGYRYDGYKVRGFELVVLDGFYVIRTSNSYMPRHINSFSTGLSIFF